jgi:hypothetical protein
MPVFRRHDADPVRNAGPMRRIMPYLMRSRTASTVFHDATYRVGPLRAWLDTFNRCHASHATVFDVLIYACGRTLQARPELNRFVSAGRLYQRRGVQISFVVKREMSDEGGATTTKVEMPAGESFAAFVARVTQLIAEARSRDRAVDREMSLFLLLPGPLLRLAVGLVRLLDAWNLYPRFMTADDPMYASLFLANLGSAGISDAYHHLYEYGTVSLFGAMSAVRPTPFVEGDRVVVAEGLSVRYTFDARIHDAFYAARSLLVIQQVLEDPVRHLGSPEDGSKDPVRRPPAMDAAS